ncbi:unnamed protein product [Didymodactylos carnosus]|uniref:Uncharacterized protein n=1 Tax=Didymodactylos carnosus TaxID=1234261 RepID=A0A814XU63_9BILA|nr:unnamed protein product [Didymodactylos carnosus]CAF3983873.1 unnamed protein product [Didymodactylos carnosus]
MLVKDPWLKHTLIEDIAFQKSSAQLSQEKQEEDKRLDEETSRKCPKCLRSYTPKETRDGSCHYHPEFVVDINRPDEHLTSEQAQSILQCAMLNKLPEERMPKLFWACCLHKYGESYQSCETGICGLPKELEEKVNMNDEKYINQVQEHFKANASAKKNLRDFLNRYNPSATNRNT